MSLRWAILTIVLCVLLFSTAAAQSTQPAPEASPWQQTITRLAGALVDGDGANLLAGLLPEDLSVRAFAAAEPESRYRMLQVTGGLTIVSARAYQWPATGVASDLSADFRDLDSMPQTVREHYMLSADADPARCNGIAAQWIEQVLQPEAGQFVAVIVLWEPPPSTASLMPDISAADLKPPLFVLVKGEQSSAGGKIRIIRIVYGDARQAVN